VVKLLLDHEASANIVDVKGSTPLHLAAWAGKPEVVDVLLSHGPSIPDVNLMVAGIFSSRVQGSLSAQKMIIFESSGINY
jgi:ankyrin repeat protein